MMKMQQAQPEFATDADGQRLVHVALANTQQRATLYAEDYQGLMDAGWSAHWQHTQDGRGNAYPTLGAYNLKGVDCLVPVARLIAQAGAGQRLSYADGNPLNLRIENLKLVKGSARYGAADWHPNVGALHRAGLTLKDSSWREGSRPQRNPRRAGKRPAASAEPRTSHTTRVVDATAVGQRSQERMASQVAGTPRPAKYSAENFRCPI